MRAFKKEEGQKQKVFQHDMIIKKLSVETPNVSQCLEVRQNSREWIFILSLDFILSKQRQYFCLFVPLGNELNLK